METPKFIRTVPTTNYLADQDVTITISSTPGSDTDTVENIPIPTVALEFEIEGKRYIILANEKID